MSNETNGIDEMFSLNAAKAGVAIGFAITASFCVQL